MNQEERRRFLIEALVNERPRLKGIEIPKRQDEQRRLLRALFNTRQPGLPSNDFLQIQDEYLRLRIMQNGITQLEQLEPVLPHLYLWQGDITTLACDAIVNAANSQMTGCWAANHICIDNSIHTFAGVQLRWECSQIMKRQGHPEPTGYAKITSGYNLPAKYVIHTVGPIAKGRVTAKERELLASSYKSCYGLAKESGLSSLAFCCISTGVFGFPQEEAAKIAISTVKELQADDHNPLDIVFNVFLDSDLAIYQALLKKTISEL